MNICSRLRRLQNGKTLSGDEVAGSAKMDLRLASLLTASDYLVAALRSRSRPAEAKSL